MAERLRSRGLMGELASEFAGTFILILFGVGVVAQVVAAGIGNHDSIAWAWGLGVVARRVCLRQAQRRPHQPGRHGCSRCVPRFSVAQGRPVRVGADRRRVRGRPSGALGLHRGSREVSTPGTRSRPRASSRHCPATTRCPCTSGAHSVTRSSAPRSCCSSSSRSPTSATPRRQPTSRQSSSACSSWRSVWRGAATPVTRSTQHVTSVRESLRSSPDTARHLETSTGISTSGCRSSRPLIGGIIGVGLYDFLIGRFLPAEGPDEAGRLPEQSDGSDSQVSARAQ